MQKVNIETQKGGIPVWTLLLTKDDDIVGFIKFNCKDAIEEYKNTFRILFEKGWGFIELDFDTEAK